MQPSGINQIYLNGRISTAIVDCASVDLLDRHGDRCKYVLSCRYEWCYETEKLEMVGFVKRNWPRNFRAVVGTEIEGEISPRNYNIISLLV